MNSKKNVLCALAAHLAITTIIMSSSPALAQYLPTDTVYRGPTQYPDFDNKYKEYSFWKIKNPIIASVSTGPDFAGHYAVARASCGTECSLIYAVDVATGDIFDLPYNEEKYRGKSIYYTSKSTFIRVTWLEGNYCMIDTLNLESIGFKSLGRRVTRINKDHDIDLCD